MKDNIITLEYLKYNSSKVFNELQADPSKEIIILRHGTPAMKIRGLTQVEILEILAREARQRDREINETLRRFREAGMH